MCSVVGSPWGLDDPKESLLGFGDEGRDSGELIGVSLEARLEWIGAMATSGVEAGRGSPGPAEAIVGNSLVALRNDLSEFMGWTVELRDGNEGTTSEDANAVTISHL